MIFKEPTDEEWVESPRRYLNLVEKYRLVIVVFGVAGIVFMASVLTQLTDIIAPDVPDTDGEIRPKPSYVTIVFLSAAMMGFAFGLVLYNVMKSTFGVLFGNRSEKLMVQCWDPLHGK